MTTPCPTNCALDARQPALTRATYLIADRGCTNGPVAAEGCRKILFDMSQSIFRPQLLRTIVSSHGLDHALERLHWPTRQQLRLRSHQIRCPLKPSTSTESPSSASSACQSGMPASVVVLFTHASAFIRRSLPTVHWVSNNQTFIMSLQLARCRGSY